MGLISRSYEEEKYFALLRKIAPDDAAEAQSTVSHIGCEEVDKDNTVHVVNGKLSVLYLY